MKQQNRGSQQSLPLNKTALETLQGVKHEGEYCVYLPRSDTRLNNVSKGWLNLMKRAKIENFRFHDLRHDFASRLVMRGVDLNTVFLFLSPELAYQETP